MSTKEVAFDFDGTLVTENVFLTRGYRLFGSRWNKLYYALQRVLYYPELEHYFILTSKPEKDRAFLQEWLKEQGFSGYHLIMAPNEKIDMLKWKRKMVKELNCIYVDFDEEVSIRVNGVVDWK